MRAICLDNRIIDNGTYTISYFTIGKYYDVSSDHHGGDAYFLIEDDNGYYTLMYKSTFKLVEDIRNEKLKQLGI